ncbi:MAG: phosphosulfolactate synthase [Flavobacteriales bacterium]|nr:phosphosulfolactate synthase [Flavobacteriales bacterium]|tara:strand:- start:2280 stop:3038 length:759 start_codon:yes stop_codon:yes gene_type:complete
MNIQLPHIPNRTEKPRENGLTMVMDKGLSVSQAENLIESSGKYIDIIKLGFGTSLVTNKVQEKIKKYQNAGIIVYLGGTLFEAFIIRDMFNDYKDLLEKWNLTHCEVSDGSISINNQEKLEFIMDLSKKYTVLSEIGYKDDRKLRPEEWSKLMNKEIEAGSWKVIAEARESGNTGIFNDTNQIDQEIITDITSNVPNDKIIWETPKKDQQIWFIENIGPNANLGNIAHTDAITLETLRLGLRGDTFFNYLQE